MKRECRKLESQLNAYLDGDLDDVSARRLLEHLDRCPACRSLVEQFHALDLPGDDQQPEPVTDQQWADRWTRIEAALPATARAEKTAAWPSRWLWSGVAAAGLLLVVSSGRWVDSLSSSPSASQASRSAPKGCSVEAIETDEKDTPAICYYSEEADLTLVLLASEDF
ncbi:MAG: zf-HC2 domain-containing protein [Planctomycetes bacterium]|nr:zf-HC2 domain-containing protein [Planctomycetota bacterium]